MLLSKSVIVAGGGSGSRMGTQIPKQFLLLNNKPVLMHTIRQFLVYDNDIEVVLVLPQFQIENWQNLCQKYGFELPHKIVAGGTTRFHSVKNGLFSIKTEGLTAVHDGVRPFVSMATIRNCFETALERGNAVPVVELTESLRVISDNDNSACDRKLYRLVQTPQVFRTSLLKKGYEQEYSEHFTDDASVVEALGVKINMVGGNEDNIKITSPFDLVIGEAICKYKKS